MAFRFRNALLSLLVHERHKAKTLWEKTGAVVMVVRRPGWLLCREVWSEIPMCVKRTAYLSLMLLILSFLVPLGGCWAVLSELPAAGPWSSPHCGGERKPRQGAGLLQEILFGESLRGSEGLMLLLYAMFWDIQRKKEGFIIKANKLYIHSHRKTSMAHKWGGCVSPCFCASVCGGTSGGPTGVAFGET